MELVELFGLIRSLMRVTESFCSKKKIPPTIFSKVNQLLHTENAASFIVQEKNKPGQLHVAVYMKL